MPILDDLIEQAEHPYQLVKLDDLLTGLSESIELELLLDENLPCDGPHRKKALNDIPIPRACSIQVVATGPHNCQGSYSHICQNLVDYIELVRATPGSECVYCHRPASVCWSVRPI